MPDFRSMFSSEYIGSWDIDERGEVTVTIESVKAGDLTGQNGRKDKKPIIYFEGAVKGFVANKTNCKTIAALYGSTKTEDWIGKRITLITVPTTVVGTGEATRGIRVKPEVPGVAK